MMAGIFIYGGINALRYPQGHTSLAKPVLDAVSPAVDKATEVAPIEQRPDDELLVKVDAGVKIAAGTMLALNRFPRLAATALAASLVPTTVAGHRFWEEKDPAKRTDQQIHLLKNLGLLGGLLIAAADTEGKPSLGWRGRRAASLAATSVAGQSSSLAGTASGLTHKLSGTASDVTDRVTEAAHEVGDRVSGATHDASGQVSHVAAGLVGLVPGAAVSARRSRPSRAADWAQRAAKARQKAAKRSVKLRRAADKRGAELRKRAAKRSSKLQKAVDRKWSRLEKRAPGLVEQASQFGHDVAGRASALGVEAVHQAEGVARDARKRVAALTG